MKAKILLLILSIFVITALAACSNTSVENYATDSTLEEQSATHEALTEQADLAQTQPKTDEADGKALVVYFSYSGNTRSIAQKIQSKTNADIFEINTTYDYPADYNAVVKQAQQEQNDNIRPQLNASVENIADYSTVFIGYPNWWGDMPMVVYSFLDEYDLSGKTIVPFCTHGGSGLSDTVSSIKAEEPNADVKDGLAIRDNSIDSSDSEIDTFLSDLGF